MWMDVGQASSISKSGDDRRKKSNTCALREANVLGRP
jgi:hypothetical protein